MAPAMRLPTSWKDHSLLQDPPFLDIFFIRKHCLHNTRTKGKRDDWLKNLAEDIQNAPDTRAAAIRWAEYAFEPDSDATHPEIVAHDHTSPETVLVFVKFYWSWFCNGPLSAQRVVDAERKRRGFHYRLPGILQQSPVARVADVSAPSTPLADASVDVRALPDVQHPTDPLPLDGVVLRHVDDAEEDKDDMVVFADEREIDVFMESCLSPLSDISSVALPDTPVGEAPDPGEAGFRSPTAVEAVSPPASGSTTAIEDEHAREYTGTPVADSLMSRYRKSKSRRKVGGNSELLSQDPEPVAAANEPSQRPLAGKDAAGKRGIAQDDSGPVQQGSRKKRNKRSNTNKPRTRSTNPITPTPQGQHPVLTSLPHKATRKSPHNPHPPTAVPVLPTQTGQLSTTRVKQKRNRKGPHKMAQSDVRGKGSLRKGDVDADERPAKRQRGKDGDDPIRMLNNGYARQHASPRPTMQLSVFGHHEGLLTRESSFFASSPAPSGSEASSGVVTSRKRLRDVERQVLDAAPGAPGAIEKTDRVVAPLPKPTIVLRPLPRAPGPRPSLGLPRDLPEADRMLRDSATDALLTLSNTVTPAEVWPAREPRAEDEYSPSDDEDIPLRQLLSASRAAVKDVLQNDDDDDDEFKDPCEWRAASFPSPVLPPRGSVQPVARSRMVSATPVPVLTPKPVGRRVPKRLPPAQFPKRPLTVQPPIWAKSRQEVCESFDYFKSYQGGVYFKGDIARGYLLGKYDASRDLLDRDGRLIISHGGGKAESMHSNKGKSTLQEASDQHEKDKSVRALLQTFRLKREIALLIDDRYALFPYDLSAKKDCTYVVLGFYHIVHAWAERDPHNNAKGYVVRWKFAFEWCERQPAPWWIPPSSAPCTAESDEPRKPIAAFEAQCSTCKKRSPRVYEQGWMCLQPECTAFWTLPDGTLASGDLTYDESFLAVSFRCEHDALEDIAPRPPEKPADGVVTSRRFSRGWHCKKCGRLSSRYKWQHWECQHCGATMQVMGKNRIPQEFLGQKDAKILTHKVIDKNIIPSLLMPYRTPDGHTGYYNSFALPDIHGKIYQVLGNNTVNGIADKIFEEYQEQAKTGELQFRRFPMRMHQCRGELLTNYFSQNSGEPYKYVGGTARTVPFNAAPSAVVKARDLIQSRMMSIMCGESKPYVFNEVLSAAYMEEQSMSFHSDAETGLGPRVASLSLGSCAHMHFRLHKKYRTNDQPGNASKSLTLFLRHGDVLIMDGADIQEFYEHTVVPMNFRIAATARFIGKNHL